MPQADRLLWEAAKNGDTKKLKDLLSAKPPAPTTYQEARITTAHAALRVSIPRSGARAFGLHLLTNYGPHLPSVPPGWLHSLAPGVQEWPHRVRRAAAESRGRPDSESLGVPPPFTAPVCGRSLALLHQQRVSTHARCPLPRQGGYAPIHDAARNGHSECLKLIIAAGVDINAKNNVRWWWWLCLLLLLSPAPDSNFARRSLFR